MNFMKDSKVRNAIFIGTLCSSSYLGVYFARNILSAVAPQIIETGKYTTEYIGSLSSVYFICYAFGQLINGMIGDRIRARYMISFGLILAGIGNLVFPFSLHFSLGSHIVYGMIGFFLSMIYAPMTKVIAENMDPIYATRCSLGYVFASFFGSPLAGIVAALLLWQVVFYVGSVMLIVMGVLCFIIFLSFEKKGLVKYNQYQPQKSEGNGIKILIQNRIIKFALISIATGVVRTTVVFWMPTYFLQYLGFSSNRAAGIFTVSTLIISMTAFVAVFLYEKLHRNMDLTLFIAFVSAAVLFLLLYFVKIPFLNIVFLTLAIMSSNCASSMLWSRYCPSLRDTGMVSTATGFLDFVSYMAASASTNIFANAVTTIGWENLILVWFGIMMFGVAINIPKKVRS